MRFNGKIFELTRAELADLDDSYIGLCIACGDERESTEPDARRYICHGCGKRAVYGTSELVLMGRVHIVARHAPVLRGRA